MSAAAIEILLSLGAALAAGLIIGAERQQDPNDAPFAGVRTFPLYALAGALGMLVGTWLLVVLGLALGAMLGIAYFRLSVKGDRLGMSTEIASLVTFGLGALCTAREIGLQLQDRLLLVAAGATATFALLAVKKPLHGWIAKVNEEDVYATVKLLVLAVIVLPLLPNEAMGPWDALNPRKIGLLVILIAGIAFAGYVAVRWLGARKGFVLTGLLGGLVSSTAVTLAMAARAKETPAFLAACAVATALASAMMFPRVIVDVLAADAGLVPHVAWPLGVAGALVLAGAAALYFTASRDGDRPETELKVENPMSLKSALKFAAFFVGVMLVSRAATAVFADAGVYVSAVLAGIADVDAIALSIAELHDREVVQTETAVAGILLAAATNTVVKAGIATVLGGPRFGTRVAAIFALALTGGAVTWALT